MKRSEKMPVVRVTDALLPPKKGGMYEAWLRSKKNKFPDTTDWKDEDVRLLAANNRRARLAYRENKIVLATLKDLFLNAGRWGVFAAVMAGVFQALAGAYPDVLDVYRVFESTVVISTLSSFVSFLIVSKHRENMKSNRAVVQAFETASNACILICTYAKGQSRRGKSMFLRSYLTGERTQRPAPGKFPELAVDPSSTYKTSPIVLVCASALQILKYSGRGSKIWPEGLSLSQDLTLLASYKKLTKRSNGVGAADAFQSCILLLAELLSDFAHQNLKSGQYGSLFKQLDLLCNAEAIITSTNTYSFPLILEVLMYTLFTIYIALVCVTSLVPDNGWNAIWLSALLAFSTIGYVYVSSQYRNPTKLSSRESGQKATVSMIVKDAERFMVSIVALDSLLPEYLPSDQAPVSCFADGFQFRLS